MKSALLSCPFAGMTRIRFKGWRRGILSAISASFHRPPSERALNVRRLAAKRKATVIFFKLGALARVSHQAIECLHRLVTGGGVSHRPMPKVMRQVKTVQLENELVAVEVGAQAAAGLGLLDSIPQD